MKKYEFTDETVEVFGAEGDLRRIRALIDIPLHGVKAGDLGGFIENEHNLSHEGCCWVRGNAKVFGDARVFDDAIIYGKAKVFGSAKVFDDARVYGSAGVFDNARVFSQAKVFGDARVCGEAKVFGVVSGVADVGFAHPRKGLGLKHLVLFAVFGGPSVMLIAAMIAHIIETILS